MNEYLNSTSILRYIEKRLGYKFEDLEIDSEDIIENIYQESLPTFSKSFPYMVRHLINPYNDLVPTFKNRYYIKLEEPFICFGINKVFLSNDMIGDDLVGMQTINTGSSYQSQLMADMISACRVPVTFDYFNEDNSVEIYPNSITNAKILTECKCVHFKDFSTIPFTLMEEFKKLAFYDTEIALLPLRKRFSNLSTAFGNIELFIGELEEADSKRTELLELWRKNFAKSSKRKKIYIA